MGKLKQYEIDAVVGTIIKQIESNADSKNKTKFAKAKEEMAKLVVEVEAMEDKLEKLKKENKFYVQVDSFRIAQENVYYELMELTKEYIKNTLANYGIDYQVNDIKLFQIAMTHTSYIKKDLTNGNTMGERLISGKHLFSENTYQEIWSAHKIRNSMVHETGFEPPVYVLTRAINQLKKGVKELGVKA